MDFKVVERVSHWHTMVNFSQKYRQVLTGDLIHVRRADMQSIDAFMHLNNVVGNEDDPASSGLEYSNTQK